MDVSPYSDVVLDVDVLFVGTTGIVSDMPLLGNVDDVPFGMRGGNFHLKDKHCGTTIVN